MIQIKFRCSYPNCPFFVEGRTPQREGTRNFDEAIRRACAHAEEMDHSLYVSTGSITKTD
jgi:hypothetical protein